MSWLKLDDGFARHPKVTALTYKDRWTWMAVLCYCARYRTDGYLPANIREHVAGDLLVFQSMLRGAPEVEPVEPDYPFSAAEHFERPAYPRMAFIENKYCGDETNWWVPNRACAEAMLRSAGFQVIDHPEEEVFVCRVAERSRWAAPVYPAGGTSRGA